MGSGFFGAHFGGDLLCAFALAFDLRGELSLTSSPPSAFRLPADAGKDGDSYS